MSEKHGDCENHGMSMPEVNFSTFIMSLASTALVSMGEVPDPVTGHMEKDLLLAKHNIDALEMLRKKTLGNLDREEENLLENVLCELRLKYVILCGNASDNESRASHR